MKSKIGDLSCHIPVSQIFHKFLHCGCQTLPVLYRKSGKDSGHSPYIHSICTSCGHFGYGLWHLYCLSAAFRDPDTRTCYGTCETVPETLFSECAFSAALRLWLCYLTGPRRQPFSLSRILKTGIPSAIQGAVFCFANIFVQASVNSFGAVSTACSTIAMNFEYLAYYVITSFGQTATTFTSQNFAAGQKKRCRHILGLCLASSVLFSLIIIVPIVIFREAFSGLFSTDPAVIANSCTRILYILFFEPVCCLYEIPSGVLRGTGHPSLPAAATVLGTCAFRIIWIFTVFRKIHTLKILFLAFPLSRAVTILLVFLCFPAVKPFGGPVLDKD